jgi:flagellar hook assembly protein FlgD
VPVVQVAVNIKHPEARSISAQPIAIDGSAIKFQCAETSPVLLSLYALDGSLVKTVLDRTLTKGIYSIRWNGSNGNGPAVTQGLYTVRLKIGGLTYHGSLNVVR